MPAAIKASWKESLTPIAFIRSLKTGSLSSMVLDILNKSRFEDNTKQTDNNEPTVENNKQWLAAM
jgi:hypothetical protein